MLEIDLILKRLFEVTPDSFYIFDNEGRWLLANNTALELFDLKDVDYQGKTSIEISEIVPFLRQSLIH